MELKQGVSASTLLVLNTLRGNIVKRPLWSVDTCPLMAHDCGHSFVSWLPLLSPLVSASVCHGPLKCHCPLAELPGEPAVCVPCPMFVLPLVSTN